MGADMSLDYKPRLSIEIRDDQNLQLQRILPPGTRVLLFRALIDGIIELYNRGGYDAISAIIGGHVSIVQLAEAGKPYTHATISRES